AFILVQGNRVGTDVTGRRALGNGSSGVFIAGGGGNNTIGGTAPGAGNLLSGNGGDGGGFSGINAGANRVQGNLIGTDATGTAALGNGGYGVGLFDSRANTIGGTVPRAGNVISGNALTGVLISNRLAVSNVVQGNYIGTDATGTF